MTVEEFMKMRNITLHKPKKTRKRIPPEMHCQVELVIWQLYVAGLTSSSVRDAVYRALKKMKQKNDAL